MKGYRVLYFHLAFWFVEEEKSILIIFVLDKMA